VQDRAGRRASAQRAATNTAASATERQRSNCRFGSKITGRSSSSAPRADPHRHRPLLGPDERVGAEEQRR
jgi:hypothetical protein